MTSLFTIDLSINMPDGGRLARKLLNLYFSDMTVDINATAYKLCDASRDVQARKFDNLTLKRADAWAGQEGSLEIFALLSVSGEDPAFIKQVLSKYIDGFPDYLKVASEGIFSAIDFPSDISLQPTNWKIDVHKA